MQIDKQIYSAMMTAIMACGLMSVSTIARADNTQVMEKCYGIVKAGKGDCDTNLPQCPKSIMDSDLSAWIYVPRGMCSRIVGGSTNPPATGSGSGNSPTPSTNTQTTTTNPY